MNATVPNEVPIDITTLPRQRLILKTKKNDNKAKMVPVVASFFIK